MAYFAIKYQLNEAKDYQTLWDELERLGAHKVTRSFYFLDLEDDSAERVRDHFVQYVDNDDMICVVPMLKKPAPHKCFKGTLAWVEARF